MQYGNFHIFHMFVITVRGGRVDNQQPVWAGTSGFCVFMMTLPSVERRVLPLCNGNQVCENPWFHS